MSKQLLQRGLRNIKQKGLKKTWRLAINYLRHGESNPLAFQFNDVVNNNMTNSNSIQGESWNHFSSMYECIQNPNCIIVSFDLFDTLFCRPTLDPTDIFRLMNYRANLSFEEFKKIRLFSDLESLKRLGPKASIVDIYAIMSKVFSIDKKITDKLMKSELDAEKKSIRVRKPVLMAIEEASVLNKTIIFTSDTYFPKWFLEELLKENNIDVNHELFISCELGKRKDNGSMYKHIISTFKCTPEQIVHIGDNGESDFQMARKNGLMACHIPSSSNYLFSQEIGHYFNYRYHESDNCILWGIYSNMLYDRIGNTKKSCFDTPYEFGLFMGPLLVSFSVWLYDQMINNNQQRLLLGYRDGYLIGELLKTLFGQSLPFEIDEIHLPRIIRHIIYSKTTGLLGSITDNKPSNTQTIKQFIKYRLYAADSQILKIMEQFISIGYTSLDQEIGDPNKLLPILPSLNSYYMKNTKPLLDELIKYCTIKLDNKKSAVFDIGYRGSLCTFFNLIGHPIDEYQLFSSPGVYLNEFADRVHSYHTYDQKRRIDTYVMEILCENTISIQEPELLEIRTSNNHFKYIFADEDSTNANISQAQKGVMDYAQMVKNVLGDKISNLKFDHTFEPMILSELLKSPTKPFGTIVKTMSRPESSQIKGKRNIDHMSIWYSQHF